MKLTQLKKKITKYQYLEDTNIIDVTMASIIANRLKIGERIWLSVIGVPSGGKTQLLRPLAMTDPKFIHELDDLTPNTFLSGVKSDENSMLLQWGSHGIISIPDFTVLFSKGQEDTAKIMSQFRLVYDGKMVKHSGNMKEPIVWTGYMGMISACTPSFYDFTEKYTDMGDRFIAYRMKDKNHKQASFLALSRDLFGKELNEKLSEYYNEYVKGVIQYYVSNDLKPEISDEQKWRIIETAEFVEKVRTHVKMDFTGKVVTKLSSVASPARISLQTKNLMETLMIMSHYETGSYELPESSIQAIEWCLYSLANEEKRAILKVLATIDFDYALKASAVGDEIGLDTQVTGVYMQNLASTGVLRRVGMGDSVAFKISQKEYWELLRRMEGISNSEVIENREETFDDM